MQDEQVPRADETHAAGAEREGDAEVDTTPAPPAASLDDLLRELRTQNELLTQQLSHARVHGYRTSLLASASAVFLGLVFFWAVAQTDWGARNFAMPVKFFVDSATGESLGIDGSDSSSDGPADTSDPYATDGYCEPGTLYDDNNDFDCDA